MSNYAFTTQPQIRKAFWQGFPLGKAVYNSAPDDYKAIVRCEFVEFVDMLERDSLISESLAREVTL